MLLSGNEIERKDDGKGDDGNVEKTKNEENKGFDD